MLQKSVTGLSAVAALGLFAGAASATTVSFFQITANGTTDVSGQLGLDITDKGGGIVSFKLSNAGPITSSITLLNLQDDNDLLFDLTSIIDGAGVDFDEDAPPKNLPAGNTVSFVSDWGASSLPPVSPNGVHPGENTDIRFSLAAGKTFADVESALFSGKLRAGLHVQSIDTAGKSETYVSNPPLPTPGTAALAAIGLLGAARRRR